MKKNNILKMSLCSMMAFGALMSPIVVSAEENGSPVEDVVNYNKAKLENLSFYVRNMATGEMPKFDNLENNSNYLFDYQDIVENKDINNSKENYFHTKYENLSPDVIDIVAGDIKNNIIESKDEGMMKYSGINIQTKKTGNATIRYTIFDIQNPEKTITKEVDFVVKDMKVEDTNKIDFNGSFDILMEKENVEKTIDIINNSSEAITINLGMKENLSTISLPKDILDAAKNKNIPLTVNVEVNGITTTWTFNNMDKTMDINLAMNLLNISDIDTLKEKDGLVLSFNHSGELPTGTVVKTYVGTKYKSGDKVQLSYFNNLTNSLEETKEYIVDSEGYVSVVINHCSNYVLEKVVENTNNETTTPSDNSTKNEINTNKTSTSSTYHVAEKPEVPNTGVEDFTMLFGQFIVSGSGLAYMLKRRK